MIKHKIVLPDGLFIDSGQAGTAIMAVELTHAVNSRDSLCLGSVCAAMAEITLMVSDQCPIEQGSSFSLYEYSSEEERIIGVFTAEKPRWVSPHRVKITAYDPVIKLEKDLTDYIAALTQWPYTMAELAQMVCDACQVPYRQTQLLNGGHPVEKFTASGVTGRQIMGWIGQAVGSYCIADPQGQILFDWYRQVPESIGPGRIVEGDTARQYYYQGKLELADYTVLPVERVQIRQDAQDIGTFYPDAPGQTYRITGNPLLAATTAESLVPVAQSLYERLQQVSYTPCTVTVPAGDFRPGDIVTVTDANGRSVTVYVMERSRRSGRDRLTCTGPATWDTVTDVNRERYTAMAGKVLRLQTDVEGLRAENADSAGNLASLALDVSGITANVTAQNSRLDTVTESLTALRQNADSLSLQVQTIQDNGVSRVTTSTGYTFSEEGLRIKKAGQEMDNLLDHSGMLVRRNGRTILQANHQGVQANDVQVGNFLVMGNHARFEDYGLGTACFYI